MFILRTIFCTFRGCILFSDVFISSGHDGSYLWNVKTGEFRSNTW